MIELIALCLIAAAIWFWLDTLRSREIATGICHYVCRQQGVQFLDGTVFLQRLRLKRNSYGQLRISRWYRFDYSVEGEGRRRGNIRMLGLELEALDLNPHPKVGIVPERRN